ncbi:MAG TPA: DUF1360 domain-containing protein [Thermoanaerobaculia bacterium]|nr:DUF1360 domain-containing protein [Thermoanaerobaculia bacterium]
MSIHPTDITASAIIALAVSAVSMTMTQGSIFAAFRTFVSERSKWLGELVSCFYCLSHWVAISAVVLLQPRPVRSHALALDLIVALFAIIAMSTIVSGLIFTVFLAAGKHRQARAAMEAEALARAAA